MKNYVLEWSKKGNQFHIQPIETTLAKNQERFMANNSHDWMVIFIGERDACSRMADNWRGRLVDREVTSE